MKHSDGYSPATSHHCFSSRFRGVAFAVLLSFAISADAQVTGISYSLSPAAEYVRFGDASALSGGFGLGGGLGFGFGEYLEVSGIVQFLPSLETNWADLPTDYLRADLADRADKIQLLQSVAPRNVTARKYGGRIRVNVGDFRYKPYVVAGTGVFRMSPDDLESASVIYGELGVGATLSVVDRFALSIGLKNLSYRLNPASTLLSPEEVAGLGLVANDFEQRRVRNFGVEASVRFYLAGRSDGNLTDMDRAMMSQFQGGNFRVAIEPMLGQINFNSALGISGSRAVAGVNAGFDLGPYIGIRGFYLRDTEQQQILEGGVPRGFGKAQYYGGELQLRFDQGFGGGLTPYGLLGGGFFDNNNDPAYLTEAGAPFDSRYFAIAGGGVELPLGSAVRIHGSARGIFMSSQEVGDVADPSAVQASPLYTVGVSFNIGGSGRTLGRSIDERFADERNAAERERLSAAARQADIEARQLVLEHEVLALQSQLARALQVAQSDSASIESVMATLAQVDSTSVSTFRAAADSARAASADSLTIANVGRVVSGMTEPDANYVSNEVVTIPVPKVGEIYIRYGNVSDTPADIIAPPIVLSSSGRILDYGGGGVATGMTADEMRAIIRQELAVSQKALRDSNAVALEQAEKRLGNAALLKQPLPAVNAITPPAVDSSLARPDSTLILNKVRIDSTSIDAALPDTVKTDSVAIDLVLRDAVQADSALVDTVAIDSALVDSSAARLLRKLPARADSVRVDSLRAKTPPIIKQ